MGKKPEKKRSRRQAMRLLSALDQYARAAHAVMGGDDEPWPGMLRAATAWLGALGYRFTPFADAAAYCPARKSSDGPASSAEVVGAYLASLPLPSPGLRERMESLDDDIAEPMVDLTKVEDATPDPETHDVLADLEMVAEAMGWTDIHRVKELDGVWRVHGRREDSSDRRRLQDGNPLEIVPYLQSFEHCRPVLEWLYDQPEQDGMTLDWPEIVAFLGDFLVRVRIHQNGQFVTSITFRDRKPLVALISCIASALRAIERLQTDDATPSPEPPKATPSLKPFPERGYVNLVTSHHYAVPEGATLLKYRYRDNRAAQQWHCCAAIVHPGIEHRDLLARWNADGGEWIYAAGWEDERETIHDPEPEEALGR